MPCPNGSITNKGDSLESVLRGCGRPNAQKNYTKVVPVVERLTYYRAGTYPDYNTEIQFSTHNNMISDIALLGTQPGQTCYTAANPGHSNVLVPIQCGQSLIHPTSATICGHTLSVGDSIGDILQACGNPANRELLQSATVNVTEYTYGNLSPNVWVFNNDILVDFITR